MLASLRYRPQAYPGRVVLYLANDGVWSDRFDTLWGWRHVAGPGLDVHVVPGDHYGVVYGPREVADDLRARMDQLIETSPISHRAAAFRPERTVAAPGERQS